jgi:hypothetical protein
MTNEFDIIEHPLVSMWLKEYLKNEPLGYVFITNGNEKIFKKMWGNPTGTTKKFAYWKKDHLGITIYVYSNNVGTFYKIQYLGEKDAFIEDKKMGTYITSFLTKLTKDFLN